MTCWCYPPWGEGWMRVNYCGGGRILNELWASAQQITSKAFQIQSSRALFYIYTNNISAPHRMALLDRTESSCYYCLLLIIRLSHSYWGRARWWWCIRGGGSRKGKGSETMIEFTHVTIKASRRPLLLWLSRWNKGSKEETGTGDGVGESEFLSVY